MPGSGKLELTGQLGEVMRESAMAALSGIRSRQEQLCLPEDFHKKLDIHVHVPEGAVPKDGPSAGITMATAMVSALTGKPVRGDLARTVEITLRGRVVPIGGLKEKSMAAYREGMKQVLIPKGNIPDLEEVAPEIKEGLVFTPVSTLDEVLSIALR
jgi:ATP-dependent Lon protease